MKPDAEGTAEPPGCGCLNPPWATMTGMAESHLKLATAVTVLVGCAACTVAPAQNPTDPTDPSVTATPDPGPTAPTREEAEGIVADYDDRNNAAIALKAKWRTADGGVLLSRDTYSDRLKAREAKNKGTKVKAGQPITTELIDVLGWSNDGDTQTLIVTHTFATAPQVSVFVKRGDAPWRRWVGVYFPSAKKLPKPADAAEQTVKDAAKAQVKSINTYRAKGTKPSGPPSTPATPSTSAC